MNLPTEVFGNVVVVHTPDELNRDQGDSLQRFIETLERDNVVFDLDNTELIDSAGLEAVLTCQEHLHARQGELKISSSNHVNRKIFDLTRLDDQLEVYTSVVDAVKSFC